MARYRTWGLAARAGALGILVLVALGIGETQPPRPAAAQSPTCGFILGFATLHELIGATLVGDCLEDQHFAENGDAQQQTGGGLLVWRKADNWTAFTDGYRTWINGPDGLVERLNSERFSWEGDMVASDARESGVLEAGQPGFASTHEAPSLPGDRAASLPGYPAAPPGLPAGVVLSVAGPDEVDVAVDDQVVGLRLIGLTIETADPAKSSSCLAQESIAMLRRYLEGQTVLLEDDATLAQVDGSGRLLRYLWLPDGRLVNLELIAQGYAHEAAYGPPYARMVIFKDAVRQAREQQRGLWSAAACALPGRAGSPAVAPPADSGATMALTTPVSTRIPPLSAAPSAAASPAVSTAVAPAATPTLVAMVAVTTPTAPPPLPASPTLAPTVAAGLSAGPVPTPLTGTTVYQLIAGSVLVNGARPPEGTMIQVVCQNGVVAGHGVTSAHDASTNRDFNFTVYGVDSNTPGSSNYCTPDGVMSFRVGGAAAAATARSGMSGNRGASFSGATGSFSVVELTVGG